MKDKNHFPYLHGFSQKEQNRLREQARLLEHIIFRDIDFSNCKNILEIGCGVGAQSEIILRRYPNIQLHSIDLNVDQLNACKEHFAKEKLLNSRITVSEMDAQNLELANKSVDGVFICWVLEHVPNPLQVLSEARRVLRPGGKIYITEVMNHTFFLDPYSPNLWKYWMAFNDYQYDQAGDPFVGAKLGNLLLQMGYKDIQTNLKSLHLDNRFPDKRKDMIDFWMELLLSASTQLIDSKSIDKSTVEEMKKELRLVSKDPNAVFMYEFMQAIAQIP